MRAIAAKDARPRRRPRTASPRRSSAVLDYLALSWVACAIILATGAWIWPLDSAVNLETEQAYATQFKALVYALSLVQGGLGVHYAWQTRSYAGLLFGAQALALLLSGVAGRDAFYGGQAMAGLFGLTFGALGTYRTLGPWRTLNCASNVILALLGVSIILAIAAPDLGQHGAAFHGQWRGAFANKNQLGAVAFLALATMWPYLARRDYKRVAVTVFLSLLCLWGSKSGTSIAVSALSLMLIGTFFAAKKIGLGRGATTGALLVVALLGYLLQDNIINLVVTSLGKDLTFSGRDEIWLHMWAIGVERPLFGQGPYYLIIDQTVMDWLRKEVVFPQLRSAHNSYLETFIEAGALGVATMISAYAVVLWRWSSSRNTDSPLSLLVLSVLIPVAVYNNFESANHLFAGFGTLFINLLLIDSFHHPSLLSGRNGKPLGAGRSTLPSSRRRARISRPQVSAAKAAE
jgi:hypothetical protein